MNYNAKVNMVDWLKMMVGNRRSEEVVDPNIEVKPSTRALKRALLTALRCVDPDSEKRPKMGQVVRMLESEEYPLAREVCYAVTINMIFFCKFFFSLIVYNALMFKSLFGLWLILSQAGWTYITQHQPFSFMLDHKWIHMLPISFTKRF